MVVLVVVDVAVLESKQGFLVLCCGLVLCIRLLMCVVDDGCHTNFSNLDYI